MERPEEGDKKGKQGTCEMMPTEHFGEGTDIYFVSCSILAFRDI